MEKIKRNLRALLIALPLLLSLSSIINAQGVMEHLDYLAHKITINAKPPSTLQEFEARKEELRKKVLDIMDLNPMPKKTPLNAKLVGEKVDLGNCYFQRVVYESRPHVYVAAHLFLPKNVTYPVPAVIHVPGHGMRDKYRPHARTYAANGFVSIELPMVGEEGKIGAGWGCGEKGPYYGHFNWYNTGYSAIAPTVWDGIRTVDYLLTLTDSNGVKLVDSSKIGMAGLSGGSARTLWTAIAEPRISCVVVNQGFTAIDKYDTPRGIENTCDIHIFYNFFGLSYAEMYSLIAPRPFLEQHGTQDRLYPNPQPVVDYLKAIYKLYDKEDYFKFVTHNQGHGYSSGIWNTENAWMDKWLRQGNSPLTIYSDRFEAELTCFPDGLPSDMQHVETLFTLPTPEWEITNKIEYENFKKFMYKHLKSDVIRTAFLDIDSELETISKEDSSEYSTEDIRLKLDEGTISHRGFFFYKPGEKRKTVIYISQGILRKNTLLKLYRENYFPAKINLLALEITGTGRNRWSFAAPYTYDRFAQIVGFTHASLQINDILAAIKEISSCNNVDANNIYLWGKGDLAVPVLYSAVVDTNVAGVILENAPDKHVGITPEKTTTTAIALFNILKYANIPQSAGLVYPRKIILAGDKKEGYNWTENLYRKFNNETNFIKEEGTTVKDILQHINPITSVGKNETINPNNYLLEQNYPNPFNPSTTICFALPGQSDVRLSVYNVLGEEVSQLIYNKMSAGYHKVNFNGSKLSSGMYLYKMQTKNFSAIKKMLLIK
jgi:dienelactone hydrolase